ncbi:MAG TPA: DUF1634 domain-containing protein [Candidatus Acidoferrales bacterium]|jgi:uncharacterized membrane protein|nr:DUF1634 domain-containing protein [Candidatus Acidoferrales bacterium]
MAESDPQFELSELPKTPQDTQAKMASPRRSAPGSKWTDERVEAVLGTLLQSGVIISGLVVLAGGILYLLRYAHLALQYENFSAEREAFRGFGVVGRGALHGDGRAIIELGLLLLIATPVARVVFSIIGFALERDRLYIVITVIVFLVLMYSLFGGAS